MRSLRAETTLTATQREAADLAPFSAASGEPQGDGLVDVRDLAVLARVLANQDVDGDSLAPSLERGLGLWPLLRDSDHDGTPDGDEDTDQDGLSNLAELVAGTDPGNPDSDADGLVDGEDGDPLAAAGVQVTWIHTDHLGSSAVLTDSAGDVVRRVRYGVWGEVRSNVRVGGPETPDPAHKFTGRRFDPATRLADYGARDYDPALARFIQPDSVVADAYDPQSLNRYAYVLGDPLSRIDPTGHVSVGGFGSGSGYNWEASVFQLASARRIDADMRAMRQRMFNDFRWAADVNAQAQRDLQQRLQQQFQRVGTTTLPVQATRVPLAPPGASIDANIIETRRLSQVNPEAALVDWVNKVRESGKWDYKRVEPVGAYEEFGNFNYGATGRALGFPREVLLRAAGFVQVLESLRTGRSHGPGSPFGAPPYGDFLEDQAPILRGTEYYDRNFWGRRMDMR